MGVRGFIRPKVNLQNAELTLRFRGSRWHCDWFKPCFHADGWWEGTWLSRSDADIDPCADRVALSTGQAAAPEAPGGAGGNGTRAAAWRCEQFPEGKSSHLGVVSWVWFCSAQWL